MKYDKKAKEQMYIYRKREGGGGEIKFVRNLVREIKKRGSRMFSWKERKGSKEETRGTKKGEGDVKNVCSRSKKIFVALLARSRKGAGGCRLARLARVRGH